MVLIEKHLRLTRWLRRFSQWDGWVVALGGLIVLAGWSFGNETLKRIFPGLVAMNPVTALSFVFAGISLVGYWRAEKKPAYQSRLARILAGLVIVIGSFKMVRYVFDWEPVAFDQLLFHSQLQHDQTGVPNQIAPNTAFNLILSGLALWLLNAPVRAYSRAAQNLSLLLGFISLVSVLGYLYRASYLYSVGSHIPMALHTATLFFVLAGGLLLAQPDFGIVALFTSVTPGGAIARRLLPFAFGIPIILGAVTMWLQNQSEVYAGQLGITVVVVVFIAVFTLLIWWNAILLNRADLKRREAEARLQAAHDDLEVRVRERTASLDEMNRTLLRQIVELQKAEEKIHEQGEQLLRTQRMESIGTLAGGIAHDLNNALAPIVMGAQLLQDTPEEADRKKLLDMISASANRSAAMVKQILSFARGSKGHLLQISVRPLVNEMLKIVQDTFPKSILVSVKVDADVGNIAGDATELHQVLLNLCINARDAMPHGGEITFGAHNTILEQELACVPVNIPAGEYVVLSIKDTGSGIPPEILPRIFEPFFTTKTPDKGTGLGLSTVAGIIKKHRGFIRIQSTLGQGTEFGIYLPLMRPDAVRQPEQPEEKIFPLGQGQLIMVMDDEQTIRQLTKATLENYGYRVLTAMSGLDGITTFEEHREKIKLLISDTDMPFTDAAAVLGAIQKLKPGIPIIIASGSKHDPERFQRVDKTYLTFLSKPYTVEQLLAVAAGALSRS